MMMGYLLKKRKKKSSGRVAFSKACSFAVEFCSEAAVAALNGWDFQHHLMMKARPIAMQTASHPVTVVVLFLSVFYVLLFFWCPFLVIW